MAAISASVFPQMVTTDDPSRAAISLTVFTYSLSCPIEFSSMLHT